MEVLLSLGACLAVDIRDREVAMLRGGGKGVDIVRSSSDCDTRVGSEVG